MEDTPNLCAVEVREIHWISSTNRYIMCIVPETHSYTHTWISRGTIVITGRPQKRMSNAKSTRML